MNAPTGTVASERFDITIVGGGMVGISLALMLAKELPPNIHIALLESFPLPQAGELSHQPSFDARSTALAAGSRRLFESIDVWSALSPHLTPIRQVHVSDRGHFGGLVMQGSDYGLEALGYVVENAWLGKVLAANLRQSRVRLFAPCEVAALKPRAEGYRLELASGENLDAGLLILADGVESSLRERLGIASDTQNYNQVAIVANVLANQAHKGVAFERFTNAGPIALLPMGEAESARQSALIWTQPEAAAEDLLKASEGEFLASLQQRFGYRQGQFVGLSQRHSYPLKLVQSREQIRRHLVVMGNAAHSLHPVAGQGFNLALRDCAALSRVLAAANTASEALGELSVLERYLAAQAADQAITIQLSHQFVRLFSTKNPAFSLLRALGFAGLDMVPAAKQAFARQTMGMA